MAGLDRTGLDGACKWPPSSAAGNGRGGGTGNMPPTCTCAPFAPLLPSLTKTPRDQMRAASPAKTHMQPETLDAVSTTSGRSRRRTNTTGPPLRCYKSDTDKNANICAPAKNSTGFSLLTAPCTLPQQPFKA